MCNQVNLSQSQSNQFPPHLKNSLLLKTKPVRALKAVVALAMIFNACLAWLSKLGWRSTVLQARNFCMSTKILVLRPLVLERAVSTKSKLSGKEASMGVLPTSPYILTHHHHSKWLDLGPWVCLWHGTLAWDYDPSFHLTDFVFSSSMCKANLQWQCNW